LQRFEAAGGVDLRNRRRVGGNVVGRFGSGKREDQVGGIEPDALAARGKTTDDNRRGGRGSTITDNKNP
jgi:hypothetical protein